MDQNCFHTDRSEPTMDAFGSNPEPVEPDDVADDRLDDAQREKRDVVPASPKTPPERQEDQPRDYGQQDEAGDVVHVGPAIAADGVCGKQMAHQAGNKKYSAEPQPEMTSRVGGHGHLPLASWRTM